MDQWVVRERGNGITSAVEERLDPIWTHVIDVPCRPFAFGKTGFAVCAELGHDGKVTDAGRSEAAARAKVAAAAPDLLAVVQGFRQKLVTYVHVYKGDKELRRLLDECDAAISKAQGDSEPGKRE